MFSTGHRTPSGSRWRRAGAAALAATVAASVALAASAGWQPGPGSLTPTGLPAAARAPQLTQGSAAPGTLTLDGCLNDDGSRNCGALPPAGAGGPLGDANAVAVSPDGNSVYVASFGSDSITHFFRAAGGQLTLDGCLSNDGSQGCGDLPPAGPGGPLDDDEAVAVSPDGKSVYVTSRTGDSVTHFFRAAGGQLTLDGCLSNDGSQNCGDLPPAGPGGPLDGATGVAVSPNGASVYVASSIGDGVTHFFRAAGGQLALDGCLSNDGSQNCGDLPPAGPGGPVNEARVVAVSPDGGSVYVVSPLGDSVTHFFRAAGGQLTLDGCLNNDGSQGCGDLPPAGASGPLDDAFGLAVSPDGRSVYVTGDLGDVVTHFFRAAGGQLTLDGCLNNDGSLNCGDLPPAGAGGPLDGARGVAVSPDGLSVYVVARAGDSVSQFARAAGGQLTFVNCLSDSGAQGCADLVPAGASGPLDAAAGVAVSPNGGSVYVASFDADSITHFFRAVPSSPTPPSPPTPPAAPPPPAEDRPVFCQGKRATIVGTNAGERLRGTSGADVVAALAGDDTVEGRGGDDLVCGGGGADIMRGGAGDDRLYGGAGADALRGGAGRDLLSGGSGPDGLIGGAGVDRCSGGPGADRANACETTRSA